jgi:hypothetical protein
MGRCPYPQAQFESSAQIAEIGLSMDFTTKTTKNTKGPVRRFLPEFQGGSFDEDPGPRPVIPLARNR